MTILKYPVAYAMWVLLYFCAPVWGQQTDRQLSLADAVALTLAKNPELATHDYRTQALVGERQNTALRPGLTLDTSLENFAGSGAYQGSDGLELTLSLASVIELGGQRDARLALASAREQEEASLQHQQSLDVIEDLTQQFIQVIAHQEYLLLQQQAQVLAKTTFAALERQVNSGRLPELERLRAQANLAQADLDTRAAREALHIERLKLANFWGQAHVDFGELRGDLFSFTRLAPQAQLLEQLANNPDLALAADESAARRAEVDQVRSQNQPDIHWSAGVRQLQETSDTALVLGLSLPLGSERRNRGQLISASARHAEAQAQQELVRLRVSTRLQAHLAAREQSLHQVTQLREKIIPLLTKTLELAEEAFQQGRYSAIELHLARRDLLDARRRVISSAAEAQTHTTAVERLLGLAGR